MYFVISFYIKDYNADRKITQTLNAQLHELQSECTQEDLVLKGPRFQQDRLDGCVSKADTAGHQLRQQDRL